MILRVGRIDMEYHDKQAVLEILKPFLKAEKSFWYRNIGRNSNYHLIADLAVINARQISLIYLIRYINQKVLIVKR